MGGFQFSENLEHWYRIHNLYETATRILFLQQVIQDLALRSELTSVMDRGRIEGGEELTWSRVQKHALQRMSPALWLQEIMQAWRASLIQGARRAGAWITEFCRWWDVMCPIAGEDMI